MKKSKLEKVAFILDRVPEARNNKKLLILTYWNLFNEAGIPRECVERIMNNGAEPEAITRDARRLAQRINESVMGEY